jgi:hypothetical protein
VASSASSRSIRARLRGVASCLRFSRCWNRKKGTGPINLYAEALKKIDLAEIASEVAKNGSKIGIIDEGLIDREADAVYEAAVLSGDRGGTVKIVACVTGVAEIHHLGLWITAYDDFRGSASFSELLASVKPLMHAALSDNSGN